jgi:hypothetical protein
LSEPFLTIYGVRQGCLLSPQLFLLVLDRILKRVMNDKMRGIDWKRMKSLVDFEYADDICLIYYKYDHMQSKLNDLCRESRKAGLMINYAKTEEIRIKNTMDRSITIENREIKGVTDF